MNNFSSILNYYNHAQFSLVYVVFVSVFDDLPVAMPGSAMASRKARRLFIFFCAYVVEEGRRTDRTHCRFSSETSTDVITCSGLQNCNWNAWIIKICSFWIKSNVDECTFSNEKAIWLAWSNVYGIGSACKFLNDMKSDDEPISVPTENSIMCIFKTTNCLDSDQWFRRCWTNCNAIGQRSFRRGDRPHFKTFDDS